MTLPLKYLCLEKYIECSEHYSLKHLKHKIGTFAEITLHVEKLTKSGTNQWLCLTIHTIITMAICIVMSSHNQAGTQGQFIHYRPGNVCRWKRGKRLYSGGSESLRSLGVGVICHTLKSNHMPLWGFSTSITRACAHTYAVSL